MVASSLMAPCRVWSLFEAPCACALKVASNTAATRGARSVLAMAESSTNPEVHRRQVGGRRTYHLGGGNWDRLLSGRDGEFSLRSYDPLFFAAVFPLQ